MNNPGQGGSGGSPRTAVALMMAVSGALFFSVFLREDIANMTDVEWSDLPWSLILRYALAMALGGALAGALLAGMFGRAGLLGWALALLGGVLASAVAGLLGSAVGRLPDLLADGWHMADVIPILAGVLVVPFAFAGGTLLWLPWLTLVAAAHLWARRRRG